MSQIRWFSRLSGGGGWSGRVVAQRKAKSLKIGLKGLSDYYSSEIAVEATRWEDSGLNKRATLKENLIKKRAGQQL